MPDLSSILSPSSVAVVGASEDTAKFGGRLLSNALQHGFTGKIYPVNQARSEIRGLRCYASIADIPQIVDLAVLAAPAGVLQESMEACAKAGVRSVIVISANFAEAGAEGKHRQDQLIATARASGMRVLGPNCLGVILPHHDIAVTSSFAVVGRPSLAKGAIGLVSQSGALMAAMYGVAESIGAGFSACISVGNQADLELCDFVERLLEDDRTSAITCYVEGFKDPARFVACLQRANELGKPILLTKAGRSDEGAAAVRSHTASIAGGYAALEAICARHHAMLFDDPSEMIRSADALARMPAARKGRIGIMSGSGGGCAVAADFLTARNQALAKVSDIGSRRLATLLPEIHAGLPLDFGTLRKGWAPAEVAAAADTVMADPNVDIGFLVLTPQPLMRETTHAVIDAARRHSKPAIIVVGSDRVAEEINSVRLECNYPIFPSLDSAFRCLRTLLAAGAREQAAPAAHPAVLEQPAAFAAARAEALKGYVGEVPAKRLLSSLGVAVPAGAVAASPDDAVQIAERIGYPVVLKVVGKNIVHKSDIGGVVLNLVDRSSILDGWNSISNAMIRNKIPDMEGCLVERMVKPVAELIVGTRYDSDFGPVVMVGFGGIFVELLRDVQVAAAPVSPEEALSILKRLTLWPLLTGARGRLKGDVPAAARTISLISHLAAALGAELRELDINPLMVLGEDLGVIAADARMVIL